MAKTRRAKQRNRAALSGVDGNSPHSADEMAELREQAEVREQLAELREQLASVGAPAEVLAALDDTGDVEEVLRRLSDAGVLPSPEESLTRLLDGWKPLLKRGTDPLSAEPWVHELGTPQVGSCFGHIDELGAQEGVTISFAHGRKPHAFVVLIDHGLGGGVKDCFATERPDRIRAEHQKVAKRLGLDFRDYQPAEARAILERALAARPCPVESDQVEDVGNNLGLLRQRVALLPADSAGRSAARNGPARAATVRRTVHRVKITLVGAKPPIWRRLEVPSGITLQDVHHSIQEAFGWDESHMWVFSTPPGEFGLPDPELGHRSAAAKKLVDVAPRAGDRIRYTYDFGDDWEHNIVVEDVLTAEPGLAYPRCVAGRRACPPEDCGGIWAYDELLEILADPAHPDHGDRLEWLGLDSADEFDPAELDLDEVNEALSDLATVLVRM